MEYTFHRLERPSHAVKHALRGDRRHKKSLLKKSALRKTIRRKCRKEILRLFATLLPIGRTVEEIGGGALVELHHFQIVRIAGNIVIEDGTEIIIIVFRPLASLVGMRTPHGDALIFLVVFVLLDLNAVLDIGATGETRRVIAQAILVDAGVETVDELLFCLLVHLLSALSELHAVLHPIVVRVGQIGRVLFAEIDAQQSGTLAINECRKTFVKVFFAVGATEMMRPDDTHPTCALFDDLLDDHRALRKRWRADPPKWITEHKRALTILLTPWHKSRKRKI